MVAEQCTEVGQQARRVKVQSMQIYMAVDVAQEVEVEANSGNAEMIFLFLCGILMF